MGSASSSICNSYDRIYSENFEVLDLMSATSVVSGAFLWRLFIKKKLLKDLSYFDKVVQERKYSKSVLNQAEANRIWYCNTN